MFCHKSLVSAYIHVENLYVKLCLSLDRFCNITAGIDLIPRNFSEDSPYHALFRIVPFYQSFDHLMMSVRVVEMHREWRGIRVMDF